MTLQMYLTCHLTVYLKVVKMVIFYVMYISQHEESKNLYCSRLHTKESMVKLPTCANNNKSKIVWLTYCNCTTELEI